MLTRLIEWLAGLWRRLTRGARVLEQRADLSKRQIRAEVHQLGAAFWQRIDGLPFVPSRTRFAPVRTQFYGHGAFMGAAPALLEDPRWRRVLGFLMPDVFDAVRARLNEGADAAVLMTMMENNPVLAAFGTVKAAQASSEQEHPNHLVGMEWDLFVDSDLIDAWKGAETPEARRAVMDRVLDTALIAHAGAVDTVQESLGISQYADVRATPKTAFGGVEMDAWLDLFGRALVLARSEDFDGAVAAMAREPRSASQEPCMLNTFETPWAVERVVQEYERVTRRPYLSIVIDIKSLHSTAEFLSGLVQHLNRFGVHVAGIGSFLREEIAGVSATEQRVGERVLPGPREVLFFHVVGDLQAACGEGTIPSGQSVMFNGASLLTFENPSPGKFTYVARRELLTELEALRAKHDLHIGFYVQEGNCEAAAASALSEVMGAWPETFELGFAWGGLRDEAALPPSEYVRAGLGSQALLVMVGKARPWEPGAPTGAS